MIEAHINYRKFVYACIDRRGKDGKFKEGLESTSARLYREIEQQQQDAADVLALAGISQKRGSRSIRVPTMLPSPANSAHSTPTAADLSSVPQPLPTHPTGTLPTAFPLVLQPETIAAFRDQNLAIHAAQWCSHLASQHLSIPILTRHFPVTWARIAGSSLSADEEHEPDIEDDEGELYWPGQSQIGEGMGWVCLMGKAMVKEFGKGIGYLGIDGVIRKEDVIRDRDMRHTATSSDHNSPQHGQPRGSSGPRRSRGQVWSLRDQKLT